jgi:hypothetical protein
MKTDPPPIEAGINPRKFWGESQNLSVISFCGAKIGLFRFAVSMDGVKKTFKGSRCGSAVKW